MNRLHIAGWVVVTAGCMHLASQSVPPETVPETESTERGVETNHEAESPPPICDDMDPDDTWVAAFLARHGLDLPPSDPGPPPDDWRGPGHDSARHRLQMLVGEISGTGEHRCVTWHPYRLQDEYFYPASSLKPIGAIAALHTVRTRIAEEPRLAAFSLDTPVRVEPMHATGTNGRRVTVTTGRTTTLRDEINASLIVSNNAGFNFTYDLAGQQELHHLMWEAGLSSVRIAHRLQLWGLTPESQRRAPRMVALFEDREVELMPERMGEAVVRPHGLSRTKIGRAHQAFGSGKTIDKPFEFEHRNAVSLIDMMRVTAWVADPNLVPEIQFPTLTQDDRTFLATAMSTVVIDWPVWQPLRAGLMEAIPGDDLWYLNKTGMAYGFHLDVSYVEQRSTGRAFLLGVALYANPNDVLNDSKYGYDKVSNPFYTMVGDKLAHELLLGPP